MTATTLTPPAVTVWAMEDGGAVVKTDGGVEAAKAAYAEWLERRADLPHAAEWSVPRELIPGYVDRARYEDRWYRWTPCHPSSCYAGVQHRPGHLEYAQGPGRGVWRGVAVYP